MSEGHIRTFHENRSLSVLRYLSVEWFERTGRSSEGLQIDLAATIIADPINNYEIFFIDYRLHSYIPNRLELEQYCYIFQVTAWKLSCNENDILHDTRCELAGLIATNVYQKTFAGKKR